MICKMMDTQIYILPAVQEYMFIPRKKHMQIQNYFWNDVFNVFLVAK